MGQSNSMLRYLGMKYGYYPEDPLLAYNCDMICDSYNDIFSQLYAPYFSSDEANDKFLIF